MHILQIYEFAVRNMQHLFKYARETFLDTHMLKAFTAGVDFLFVTFWLKNWLGVF